MQLVRLRRHRVGELLPSGSPSSALNTNPGFHTSLSEVHNPGFADQAGPLCSAVQPSSGDRLLLASCGGGAQTSETTGTGITPPGSPTTTTTPPNRPWSQALRREHHDAQGDWGRLVVRGPGVESQLP